MEIVELEDGTILGNVHNLGRCLTGGGCAIHNPSDHPLKNAARTWYNDMIYRICPHAAAHPDFDSLVFIIERDGGVWESHKCCVAKCCGIPEVVDID